MKMSQILIIAIDSPHMMEMKGRYHEIFNRATIFAEQIRRIFQGNVRIPGIHFRIEDMLAQNASFEESNEDVWGRLLARA